MRCIVVVLTIFGLLSCSAFNRPPSAALSVSVPDSAGLKFSGKGAGAGMMLMSSMGPMGIAIGVAIDQGIAKDIAAAGEAAGFNLETQLRAALAPRIAKNTHITVERYGFIISPQKGGDITLPQLHLLISPQQGTAWQVRIPEELPQGCKVLESDLTELKNNGQRVVQAMQSALACVPLG